MRQRYRRARPVPRPTADFESTWELLPDEDYVDPDWHEQRHFQRSQQIIVEFIEAMVGNGGLSLLDVPCGNGRLYRGLQRAGLLDKVEYRGADITTKLLDAVRTLHPEVQVDQASAEHLPYADNSFDVVVTQHLIRHLPYYEDAVRELLRVSRRIVLIAEKDIGDERDELGHHYNEHHRSRYWVNNYEPTRLKQFARNNGAAIAFMLNNPRSDEPDGQVVYGFVKRGGVTL